jgi:U6 snRNA-associated Sm-like protein LSm8
VSAAAPKTPPPRPPSDPRTYSPDSDSPIEKVLIVTLDSRVLVGKLESYDQLTNLVRHGIENPPPDSGPDQPQVLSGALERVIRTPDEPEDSQEVPLGLYIVRGDNVCTVGLVDEELDNSINWAQVKGSAIGTTKHS